MVVIPDRASQRNNFESSRCRGRGSSASVDGEGWLVAPRAIMAGCAATAAKPLPSSQASSRSNRSGRP